MDRFWFVLYRAVQSKGFLGCIVMLVLWFSPGFLFLFSFLTFAFLDALVCKILFWFLMSGVDERDG